MKTTPAKKTISRKAKPAPVQAEVVTELPKDAQVLGNTPTPPIELTVKDIAHFKQILEVVSSRGAFKPEEMILVGETYSRLTAFLEASK